MPYSEKQRRFFFSELNRKKKGARAKTRLSKRKLTKLAHAPIEREMER